LQRDQAARTVLTVGSLHYDIMVEADHLPRRDETAVGRRWYPKFGGKGGNQSVAVARAGVASRMLGAVGADGFGDFLRDALRRAGVDDRFVAVLEGAGSGMSVAIQDRLGDYAATIVSGANLLIDPLQLDQDDPWRNVGLLVLQNEVPESVNLAAARAARNRGISCLLNAAPFRPLSEEVARLVDLIVVNAVEAEMLGLGEVQTLAQAEAAAAGLAQRFPASVVTVGAQGLALCSGQAPVGLPARAVKVVSTHGAGDAFIGAMAAAMIGGNELADACRAASEAAARHVAGEAILT